MSWIERYTTQGHGESLGTVTGSPEISREGKGGSSDTLHIFDVYTCTALTQPAKYRTVSPGGDIAVR